MSTPTAAHDLDRPVSAGETIVSTAEIAERPETRCQATADDEPMGGDPPCWAHLFEDDEAGQDG